MISSHIPARTLIEDTHVKMALEAANSRRQLTVFGFLNNVQRLKTSTISPASCHHFYPQLSSFYNDMKKKMEHSDRLL